MGGCFSGKGNIKSVHPERKSQFSRLARQQIGTDHPFFQQEENGKPVSVKESISKIEVLDFEVKRVLENWDTIKIFYENKLEKALESCQIYTYFFDKEELIEKMKEQKKNQELEELVEAVGITQASLPYIEKKIKSIQNNFQKLKEDNNPIFQQRKSLSIFAIEKAGIQNVKQDLIDWENLFKLKVRPDYIKIQENQKDSFHHFSIESKKKFAQVSYKKSSKNDTPLLNNNPQITNNTNSSCYHSFNVL